MRTTRLLLMIPLGLTLALAGCGTPGIHIPPLPPIVTPPPAPGTPVVDQSAVEKFQQVATRVCNFEPTFETAASILTTFTGGQDIARFVESAARGLCSTVTAKGARRNAAAPLGHYRGVKIDGNFVRR